MFLICMKYTPVGERPRLVPTGFCGRHNVNNIEKGAVSARHHVTMLTRLHETHYNTSLILRTRASAAEAFTFKPFFSSRFFSSDYVYYTIETDEETKVWQSLAC